MSHVSLADIKPLPGLLGPDGFITLMSAAEISALHPQSLRAWCHTNARYGIVTRELVSWLRDKIAGRKAIEIGAGAGDLSHHLGITPTDSFIQNQPDVAEYYRLTKQPTIRYPSAMLKYDAVAAVKALTPDVVVASWVTEWIDARLPPPPSGGSVYGVKENEILDLGVTYILIGNTRTHGAKAIMARPHEEYRFDWLRSRSEQALDRIWVWNGRT